MASTLIGIGTALSVVTWVGVPWLVAAAGKDERRHEQLQPRSGFLDARHRESARASGAAPMQTAGRHDVTPMSASTGPELEVGPSASKVNSSTAIDVFFDSQASAQSRTMDLAESPHNDADSARTCIFCDRPAGSTEYLWPEWLCRRLTDNPRFRSAQRQNVHADSLLIEQMRNEVDQTVTCLCEQCTHGWLQRLDDDMSGFLISMVEGNKTRLSPRQQRLLARWAAKTAVVTEYVYDDPVLTPRPVREYLRRVGVHPGTQVLLGRYDGAERLLAHERDLFRRTIDDTVHHLSQSTLVIGKVLIQVFADPWRESAPQPAEDTSLLVPLVPSRSRKVEWPPDLAIDDTNYRLVRRGPT